MMGGGCVMAEKEKSKLLDTVLVMNGGWMAGWTMGETSPGSALEKQDIGHGSTQVGFGHAPNML